MSDIAARQYYEAQYGDVNMPVPVPWTRLSEDKKAHWRVKAAENAAEKAQETDESTGREAKGTGGEKTDEETKDETSPSATGGPLVDRSLPEPDGTGASGRDVTPPHGDGRE